MQLAAASGPSEVPRHLETELQRLADEAPSKTTGPARRGGPLIDRSAHADSGQSTREAASHGHERAAADEGDEIVPLPSRFDAYQLRVLDTVREGARVVVGGLIMEAGRQDISELDVDFLRGLSSVLFDERVTTVVLSTVSGV
jgi:hypothetical protein